MHGYDFRKHPVIGAINHNRFAKAEESKLLKLLKRRGIISEQENRVMRSRVGFMEKARLLGVKQYQMIENIARTEKAMTPEQRRKLVSAGLDAMSIITGIPRHYIEDLIVVNWTPKNFQELIAQGPAEKPMVNLKKLPPQEAQKLHALVSKRINHDLLIHGNSMRLFVQAFPLMREAIESIRPGLYNQYVGYSALLKWATLAQEGMIDQAIAAGRSEMQFNNRLQAIANATCFPALFNEMSKGVYEALLHEGLPEQHELSRSAQEHFKAITADIELEGLHQKISPRASQRVHTTLTKLVGENKNQLTALFEQKEHPVSETYMTSLMYKAFALLSPRETDYFMHAMVKPQMNPIVRRRLFEVLLNKMEEVL
jgi:hypothetical protein